MSSFCRVVPIAVLTVLTAAPLAVAEPAWTWPVTPPPEVVRPFDKPDQNWLPGHRGVDLASTVGTVVVSAGSGHVFFAGEVGGKQVVSVEHADGLRTTYEPVAASVSTGDVVAAGDPIGVLLTGHAECEVAACLHWGLRRDDDYLDPLLLVAPRNLRLKPL